MSDEDVIRRRLLIDGDGTGDDRRLNVLLKSFIKWCNSTNETPQESALAHDRMLAQLSQCEFAMTKSRLSAEMSAAELRNYESLAEEIERRIQNAKEEIESTKQELQEAKTVRKNRIEYDVLAKVINEQPDRRETDEKLSTLRKELGSLKETEEQLERKLDMRRKQFHVLVASIHQLQAMLDEDAEDIMDVALEDPFDDELEIRAEPMVE
ncbi:THO complex subunit 7 homolog [Schistocerca americana]|uniref:THO complex subunit 7 homolog n=1 Tax=Schistocerca americana TaxID=7009 RepID=UPI001F50143E|nr:THO complex subunit 7 homolog [Schistocerca americana]XP_047119727.1 THO complex subunit 7 homolog [Schistocerca piceifrons]XP_049763843.1 THO complex subunit 7 homolog [Schistocerca cancellata]XP_049790425.1 THO complex subunit 7 homolog [Schistocerca nitens]XP_049833361.1 THO complex subunit 7 homolog [Schistocerca gregaria]XP_049940410.1 THO complex subunit 7 homolog [Schistocerca serialis cubense]